jgi:hypothetical protein
MHWQDVAGALAGAGRYLVDIFWKPDRDGFPDPDIARNIGFTVATFIIGWLASLSGTHRRARQRVINELILSQSELRTRAWPKSWRMTDVREAWMLDPFVARLRFLYASVSETKSLSGKQLGLVDNYIKRVEDFIEKWEETQVRRDSYRYAYDQTYHALRAAAKALGLKDNARFTGLGSPKDELFGGSPAPSAAPAPQGARPGLWAPAE